MTVEHFNEKCHECGKRNPLAGSDGETTQIPGDWRGILFMERPVKGSVPTVFRVRHGIQDFGYLLLCSDCLPAMFALSVEEQRFMFEPWEYGVALTKPWGPVRSGVRVQCIAEKPGRQGECWLFSGHDGRHYDGWRYFVVS